MIRGLIWPSYGLLEAVIHIVLGLAGFGVRHPIAGLIVSRCSPRSSCSARRAQPAFPGWRRARSIRFRLWLWLRPGAGFASLPELWLRWGRLAALSSGRRARPACGGRLSARRQSSRSASAAPSISAACTRR